MVGLIIFIAYWIFTIRKQQDLALMSLFLIATACYQLVPYSFVLLNPYITKPYDWVLLVILFHIIIYFLKIINFKSAVTWPLKIFLVYLGFLLIFSVTILNIDTKIALAVFRNYIFYLAPIIFIGYDFAQIKKALKLICFFTVLIAVLFLIQGFIGVPLLTSMNSEDVQSNVGAGGITRYYNMPFYLVFALFYYANHFFKNTNAFTALPVVILLAAVVISFNRNTEIVAALGLVFLFFHKKKVTLVNIGVISVITLAFAIISFANQSDRGKYEGSDLKTITDLDRLKDPSRVNESKISSFRFRVLHFYERYLYVYDNSPVTYLFGIGLVNDQYTPYRHQLNFNIGTATFTGGQGKSEKGQIDTSDIVWSLFILQTGMLGIIIFISVIVGYIKVFLKNKDDDIFYISAIYLFALLLTSIFGVELQYPSIILLISMLYISTLKIPTLKIKSVKNDLR